ncbi:toprim domain-containing protein [Mucilaginibacter sp. UYCu711]|uniref:toprim domain-containing protein n=1 Tax=Mucilaginibacter sp. UYCu711 TaxID=3156339 RepID=UPI003D1FC88F
MAELLTAGEVKDTVSLADLLGRLGFRPAKRSGKELYFSSMVCDSDTKSSFTVNEDLNVWYDHGLGKGGNVIDFCLLYWKTLSFSEVLAKISETCQGTLCEPKPANELKRRRHAIKLPHYHIEELKDLGNNALLTAYLQQRGVWEMAHGRLQEIYYYIEDEKRLKKFFFAAGWKNEQGAWEVRNRNFKGCLGHKAITLVPGNDQRLVIFEGYFNYLSWLIDHENENPTVLILNALSLLELGKKIARSFHEVDLFFDRDLAGHTASIAFAAAIPQAIDRSEAYLGYNDYNDHIVAVQWQFKSDGVSNTLA